MKRSIPDWGLFAMGVAGGVALHVVFTWIFVLPAFYGLGAGG